MSARVTRTATSELQFGYKVEASVLKEFFEVIPDNADITVKHWQGDQRDPTETTITATWSLT